MKKKLLILGGATLHCGIVETAKQMGIEAYVADYLSVEESPAKQIADHAWDIDVYDCDRLIEKCKNEGIDGVLNVYLHSCQIPYQKICEGLGLPCFASLEQYELFTNKKKFLQVCENNGVDIIKQYSESDFSFDNPDIDYPVYVKPSDSRGTRGQKVCRNYDEVTKAIKIARDVSSDGEIIIERFMEGCQDIQLTYFMIEGEPYLECIGDKYNGTAAEGYQGSVIAGVCPSANENIILSDADPKIRNMLKKLGLCNTPVFLQGFLDGRKLRLYDPALRLPGFIYEQIMKEATGLDVYRAMINYSLTGSFPEELTMVNEKRKMGGKLSITSWIFIRAGEISEIQGVEEILKEENVIRINTFHKVGDRIEDWRNINNNFCEIAMLCSNIDEAKHMFRKINETIQIMDENGEDMKIVKFDIDRLDTYEY